MLYIHIVIILCFILCMDTVPASIVISTQDSRVELGGSYSLMCTAQGFPLPQFTWLKDGTPLSNSSANTTIVDFNLASAAVTSILELCEVELMDTGVYSCVAANTLASGSQEFNSTATARLTLTVLSTSLACMHEGILRYSTAHTFFSFFICRYSSADSPPHSY